MTTTDDRSGYTRDTITCPSWCTSPAPHLDDGTDSVLHDTTVLEVDLPALTDAEGGRAPGSYVKVSISQYVDVRDRETAAPVVFLNIDSRDYDGAVASPRARRSRSVRRSARQPGSFSEADAVPNWRQTTAPRPWSTDRGGACCCLRCSSCCPLDQRTSSRTGVETVTT